MNPCTPVRANTRSTPAPPGGWRNPSKPGDGSPSPAAAPSVAPSPGRESQAIHRPDGQPPASPPRWLPARWQTPAQPDYTAAAPASPCSPRRCRMGPASAEGEDGAAGAGTWSCPNPSRAGCPWQMPPALVPTYLQGSPALPQLLLDVFLRRVPCLCLHLHPLPQGEHVAAKSQGEVGEGCLQGGRARGGTQGEGEATRATRCCPQGTDIPPSMPPSRVVLRIISTCFTSAPARLLHAGDSPPEMPA